MTIDEAKAVMVKMGYTPGRVNENRGWIHVWSVESQPGTRRLVDGEPINLACISYDKETGYVTEHRLDGQGRYYKYDEGDEELRRAYNSLDERRIRALLKKREESFEKRKKEGTLEKKDDRTLKEKGDGFFASLKRELLRGWKG